MESTSSSVSRAVKDVGNRHDETGPVLATAGLRETRESFICGDMLASTIKRRGQEILGTHR